MEEKICEEYLNSTIGIESLAYKYHIGKLKVKEILSKNGIETKKRGNQKNKDVLVVPDWRIEKYEPNDGFEYVVFDPKTPFKSKDIRNDGGKLTTYLKKAYGLNVPTLYDRRMYYMKTGNYWWEQWLSVEQVPVDSVVISEEEVGYIEKTEDNISNVVSNRIKDAVPREKVRKIAKVQKTTPDGVKKTKEEIFTEKARLAHPDENLDYSEVIYVDKSTPVYIIDHDLRPDGSEYGGYWQRPENHLRGSGHPDKFLDRMRTKVKDNWDSYVKRFKEAHPGENIEYIKPEGNFNLSSKIHFIDHDLRPDGAEYGDVWQVAREHLKGRKHPAKYHDSRIGSKPVNKKTNEQYIEDCRKVWGDRYGYEKCVYKGKRKLVTIVCPEHGDFRMMAENFMHGHGCPKCGNVHHYTTEEFKEKIKEIHGDKYNTDKVEYVNAKTKVCLVCPEHGEFWITPNKLLNGQGCYECGRERIYESTRLKIEDIIERAKKVHNNRYTYDNFKEYTNNDSMIVAECQKHGEFRQTVASHLAGCGCPSCSCNTSKAENDLYDFIVLLGFNAVRKDRDVLNGLEIDIYIPDKKFGIEYNGLYWHSEANGKDMHYHLNKTEEAERKGVRLLQVFEDEWVTNPELVKVKIKHILGKDNSRIKAGARKCRIRAINKETAEEFLTKWHIQGFSPSTLYYGAEYSGELVGVMSFKRYKQDGEWELTRFATNGIYSVPGLGGKIFQRFVKDREPEYVKSFADRRWTLDRKNNLYTRLGFSLNEVCRPDYRYVVGSERKHKFGFRKKILNRKYGVPLEWTEKQMCDELGFYRIWDCGLFKYVWRKNKDE